MSKRELDDRIDRSVNFSPWLFRAWYASVISASTPHDQSDVARSWWNRIDARYRAMTGGRHVLDPAWIEFR